MKRFNFLFSLMATMMLLWGGSAKAQLTASTEAELMSAMSTLQATSGGGTITLTANISINSMTSSYATSAGTVDKVILSSVAGNPITIDCSTFRIEVAGSGTWDGNNNSSAGARSILSIGEYVTVKGTGGAGTGTGPIAAPYTVLVVPNNATLEVTSGGKIINTATANGVAVSSRGRTIIRDGALVRTESNGGIAVETSTYGIMVAGGTIEAVGNSVVALQYGGPSGTPHVICSGAQVSAEGKGAVGIKVTVATANIITIGLPAPAVPPSATAGAIITTSSPDNSDIAVQSVGSNVGVNAGSVSITASKIYDGPDDAWLARVSTITASPDAGTMPLPTDIALSSSPAGDIYYGIDVDPTNLYDSATPTLVNMADDGTLNTKTTITDADNNTFTTTHSFAYVNGEIPEPPEPGDCPTEVTVTSFQDTPEGDQGLKTIYECSQTGDARTTTITLGANITLDAGFTMNPADDHPVKLVTTGFTLITGTTGTTTLQGALTIVSESTATNNILPINLKGNTTFGEGLTITSSNSATTNTMPVIDMTANNIKLTIDGGTYSGTQNIFIRLSNPGELDINDGKFDIGHTTTSGTNINNYAIPIRTNATSTITIYNGTFDVGAGGRVVYIGQGNNSIVTIKDGDFTVDSNGGSMIGGLASGSSNGNSIIVEGGIFDVGIGTLLGLGGNGSTSYSNSFIMKAADKIIATNLFSNNSTYTGAGNQKYYDLRPDNITATANEDIDNVTVLVTLGVKNYDVPTFWYSGVDLLKASSSLPTEAMQYDGTPIPVSPGETLYVYTAGGNVTGVAEAAFSYDDLAIEAGIITGITTPSIDAAKVYIEGSTLYLPESGSAVQVYNVSGQLVLNAVATGATVDVSSLGKGVYVVKTGSAAFKVVK